MKKRGIEEKPHIKKKPGLVRVRPGHGSTRWVDRVLALASLLINPDWSSYRVDQVLVDPPITVVKTI